MGFLSALIVGPCVAPLAGALIYIGQSEMRCRAASACLRMAMGMGDAATAYRDIGR